MISNKLLKICLAVFFFFFFHVIVDLAFGDVCYVFVFLFLDYCRWPPSQILDLGNILNFGN